MDKKNSSEQLHKYEDASFAKNAAEFSTSKLYASKEQNIRTFPATVPIAGRIKNARKSEGLSQKELAEKMKVTRNTVINWESGKYRPDLELIPALCSILKVPLNELFGLSPVSHLGISEEEWKLLGEYRQISPVGQRIVERMVSNILTEEVAAKDKLLDDSAMIVDVISSAAAAGDGYGYHDIPIEDYQFVFQNSRNEKADGMVRIKGDSMLPVYQDNDFVYVQYTNIANFGEDVIVRSNEGIHIKRLGEKGIYSLNKALPFTLTSPEDNVQIIGRVLGIVSSADYPSQAEVDSLRRIRRDEIREFKEKHHLS